MPLFIDFHDDMQGVSREAVCDAHLADVEIQDRLGVRYHKFWVNEERGFVFCLIEGPSKEACEQVHRMSHGHVACEIVEVSPTDVASFMGPGRTDTVGQVVHPDGKYDSAVRTFMFTDIVGSTDLTRTHGDVTALRMLRKHNSIVRAAVGQHAGREVKHTGDGIMACFSSAAKCVQAAIQIQRDLGAWREESGDGSLRVKIGINAGEPVTEGDDFFGVAVQLTSRLCDLANANEILASSVVRSLCMGRGLEFQDVGCVELKGFDEPVHVSEVRW